MSFFLSELQKKISPSHGIELEGRADGIATHVHDQTIISIVPVVLHAARLGMFKALLLSACSWCWGYMQEPVDLLS